MRQKPPAAMRPVSRCCNQRGLITAAWRRRYSSPLLADAPRLARDFAAAVQRREPLNFCAGPICAKTPSRRLRVLATHPSLSIDPDALAAGFDTFSRQDGPAAPQCSRPLCCPRLHGASLRAHLKRLLGALARFLATRAPSPPFGSWAEPTDTRYWSGRALDAIWASISTRPWLICKCRRISPPTPAPWAAARSATGTPRALDAHRPPRRSSPVYARSPDCSTTTANGRGIACIFLSSQCPHLTGRCGVQMRSHGPCLTRAPPQLSVLRSNQDARRIERHHCGLWHRSRACAQLARAGAGTTHSITTLRKPESFDMSNCDYPRPYKSPVAVGANWRNVARMGFGAVIAAGKLFPQGPVSPRRCPGLEWHACPSPRWRWHGASI